MGGSNDGSGTVQAAEDANDQDAEDESAAEPRETTAAETAPAAAGPGSKATGEAMSVISEERTTSRDGLVNAQDSDGALDTGGASRKGGALSSPDQTVVESTNGEEAATPSENPANGVDEGNVSAAPVLPPLAGASAVDGILRNPGEVAAIEATESLPGSLKNAAGAGAGKHSESGQGRQATGEGGGGAASNGVETSKKAVAKKKEVDGVEELMENTVSHTVDCLIFIRWYVRQGDSGTIKYKSEPDDNGLLK